MDLWTIGLILVAALLLYVTVRVLLRRMRYRSLAQKYDSDQIAADIITRKIWQGMSEEQLVDSWGRPADVDTKVLKTKTTATWKYGHLGANRYKNRVKVDDGVVTGWELK